MTPAPDSGCLPSCLQRRLNHRPACIVLISFPFFSPLNQPPTDLFFLSINHRPAPGSAWTGCSVDLIAQTTTGRPACVRASFSLPFFLTSFAWKLKTHSCRTCLDQSTPLTSHLRKKKNNTTNACQRTVLDKCCPINVRH
jgi:hypothetical protein